MKNDYTYSVAISFAEEDRNIALAIALALEIAGVKDVYYYPFKYEETWGHDLEARLTEIYKNEARYAVALLSENYQRKRFAQVELAAIRHRILEDSDIVYMLPVITGGADTGQWPDIAGKGYFEWVYNPTEIASSLAKMLGVSKSVMEHPAKLVIEGSFFTQKNLHIGDNIKCAAAAGKSEEKVFRNNVFKTEGNVQIGNNYSN